MNNIGIINNTAKTKTPNPGVNLHVKKSLPLSIAKLNMERQSLAAETFIEKAKEIHGDKYIYKLVRYTTSKTKVKIVCKIHGIFEQRPDNHLAGKGCKECGVIVSQNNSGTSTTKEFIQKAKKIHGNKYKYSAVKYINNKTNVAIICKEHGIFEQRPDHHLSGKDCPACMNSLNESKKLLLIDEYLSNHIFEREKIFEGCKFIKSLRFDRFLSELNLCIEYDGEQHFKATKFFGGVESLKKTQKRDTIKNKYCRDQKINLLRIKYNQDPIVEIENIIKKIKENPNQLHHIFYGKQKRFKNV